MEERQKRFIDHYRRAWSPQAMFITAILMTVKLFLIISLYLKAAGYNIPQAVTNLYLGTMWFYTIFIFMTAWIATFVYLSSMGKAKEFENAVTRLEQIGAIEGLTSAITFAYSERSIIKFLVECAMHITAVGLIALMMANSYYVCASMYAAANIFPALWHSTLKLAVQAAVKTISPGLCEVLLREAAEPITRGSQVARPDLAAEIKEIVDNGPEKISEPDVRDIIFRD